MTDPRASEAADTLNERCTGRVVAQVLVHGINSLKTAEPPLAALAGVPLGPSAVLDGSRFEVAVGPFRLVVDLQRTGRLKLIDHGKEWLVGQPSMPTVQVIFTDGCTANFVEAAKTKRIALRVERCL